MSDEPSASVSHSHDQFGVPNFSRVDGHLPSLRAFGYELAPLHLRYDDEVRDVLCKTVHVACVQGGLQWPILTLRQVLCVLLDAGEASGSSECARLLRGALGNGCPADFSFADLVDEPLLFPWPVADVGFVETLISKFPDVVRVLERAADWVKPKPIDLPALALSLAAESSEAVNDAFEPLKPLTRKAVLNRWLDVLNVAAEKAGHGPSFYDHWLYDESTFAAPVNVLPDLGRPRHAGDDCLGVSHFARALAATAVARATEPPLAIGVFGDWGGGKSHFMGLMEHEMRALATMDGAHFHQHVLPVWFNAWHYADANLWASLMQALLEAIAEHCSPKGSQTQADDFACLLRQLDKASSDTTSARTELAAADRAADEAKESFNAACDEAQGKDLVLRGLRADEFCKLFSGQSGKSIGKRLADELQALGFDDLAKSAGDAGSRYDEIIAVTKQAETLITDSRSFWLALRKWRWGDASLLAALALGCGGLIWTLQAESFWQIIGATATVTGSCTAGLGWLRQRFEALTKLRERLAEIRQKQEEAVAKAAFSAPGKAAEAAQRGLEAARQRLDAALAARQQAAAAVAESFASARIASFVEQRLKSGLYREQLSLVSTIRGDLQTIEQFLDKARKDRQQEADTRKQLGESGQATIPPLDRIVLFIDDLDRCPPERVVEVLEAVHLLLAIPLFVVVVGVDVRWVSAALCRRYDGLLAGAQGSQAAAGAHRSATPADYLEKIFQLPFRLSAIETDGGNRLLHSLIDAGAAKPATASASDGEKPTETPAGDGTAESRSEGAGTAGPSAQSTPEQGPETAAQAEQERREVGAGLEIGAEEGEFMQKLLPTLGGSPRRVRRFVNSYRVYKASLSVRKREMLLENGDYRLVLAALALQIGLGHRVDEVRRCAVTHDGGANADAWLNALEFDAIHSQRLGNARAVLRFEGDAPESERIRLIELLSRPDIARFSFAPALR